MSIGGSHPAHALSIFTTSTLGQSTFAPAVPKKTIHDGDNNTENATAARKEKALRWMNLVLMVFVLVGFGMCNSLFSPFFPTEAARRNVSATTVGFVFSSYTLVMFIGSIVSGALVRTLGLHFMIGSGTLLAGGATIIFGLVDQTPVQLTDAYVVLCFCARIVEGIGASLYNIAAYSMMATLFPENISMSYAALETAFGAGAMLGPTIGGALFSIGGFTLPFIVVGSLLFAFGFISQILLRITLPPEALAKSDENKAKRPELPWSHFYRSTYEIWILTVAMATSALVLGFPSPTLALHFEDLGLYDTVTVGLVFLGGSLTYTVLSLIVGKMADSFPKHHYLIMMFGGLVIALSFVFIGPAPFLQPTIEPSVSLTITAYIINAAGCAIIINPTPAAILASAHSVGYEDGLDTSSMVAGVYNAMWYLGAFSGTPLAGLMMDTIGFAWGAFIMAMLGFAMSIMLTVNHFLRGSDRIHANRLFSYALFQGQSVTLSKSIISKSSSQNYDTFP